MKNITAIIYSFLFVLVICVHCTDTGQVTEWKVNDLEYLEAPGFDVLVFHNYYPSGKQGGIEIIHHGERIATNGFIRMERVDGRRFPDPERAEREIDLQNLIIKSKVEYEDFDFRYDVSVIPENENIRLTVDLDKPIPSDWEGKLNFTMEFFPPLYIGKTYQLGKSFGTVPLQANGPLAEDDNENNGPIPLAQGKICTLAGEDPLRKIVVESLGAELELVDDRNLSGRGWLLVKATIPAGVTKNAVEWVIRPNVIPAGHGIP